MSMRTLALVLLAPLACTARPLDGEASATDATGGGGFTATTATGGVDPGTTTAPQPTSTAAATDPSTSAGTANTSANFTDMGQPPPGGPCDPWLEDCPEGQKCMPYADDGGIVWNAYKCSALVPDPDGLGEPCSMIGPPLGGEDTCEKHTMCWDVDPDTGLGTCIGMCTGTLREPGCADPNALCIIPADGVLQICLPTCHPLLQDCAADELCLPNPHGFDFLCIEQAEGFSADVFETCEFLNTCAPGLVCVIPDLAAECDPVSVGCCLPFCDLSLPNDCPGQGQQCLPWYEQGKAPAGLESVGVCGIPQP